MENKLNVMALCAGCGGLELGIELALRYRGQSARGICYVEREVAAAASLVASMEAGWLHPAPIWPDVLTFDARPWRSHVHILASGDPCQDNSVAGKRAGSDGERFLAPEVVRIADECRPDLIFRENVPGNADGQLAALVPALERLGYRVAAGIFSSAETGNSMRRERLFIMAIADDWEREDGPERTERRTISKLCGKGGIDALPRGQEGSVGLGASGVELEHAAGGRCGREGDVGEPSGKSSRAGIKMARTGGARLQGRQPGRADAGLQRASVERGGGRLPPAVIPGPTDSRWIDILDRWPELQPALSQEEAESHLRRGVDAMAHRVERLRATGNGVDPVAAAHAFLSLYALLACRA